MYKISQLSVMITFLFGGSLLIAATPADTSEDLEPPVLGQQSWTNITASSLLPRPEGSPRATPDAYSDEDLIQLLFHVFQVGVDPELLFWDIAVDPNYLEEGYVLLEVDGYISKFVPVLHFQTLLDLKLYVESIYTRRLAERIYMQWFYPYVWPTRQPYLDRWTHPYLRVMVRGPRFLEIDGRLHVDYFDGPLSGWPVRIETMELLERSDQHAIISVTHLDIVESEWIFREDVSLFWENGGWRVDNKPGINYLSSLVEPLQIN